MLQKQQSFPNLGRVIPQSPPSVRLGLAGCGNVLTAYLSQIARLSQLGAAELVVLCGREHQRDSAGPAWRSVDFVTHYPDLLARKDVDVVVLLTPMQEHAHMAKAALEAGKHVLVEKPMATTLEPARELLALAEKNQRHLFCAPFTVLSPTYQTIGQRLQRGELGRVISARGRYGWAGPDWTSWFYQPGGGALFDLGVYCLTSLTGWLGPVRRVAAMTGVAVPIRKIGGKQVIVVADDNAQVLLDFGDSCFAVVTTGFNLQQSSGPGLELFGTEGTLYLRGDDWDPDGYELWRNSSGCWQRFLETQPDWPWTDGLRHLVDCLRSGAKPLVSARHAFHVLEVMLQAQAAGGDGRTRTIESTFDPLEFSEARQEIPAHRIHDRTRVE